MQVIINGRVVNYAKQGSGPVLVLLHGWGDNLKTFTSVEKELKEKFTLVAVDLPGFGGSQKPINTYDLSKYAEFVSDFLEKVSLENIYAYIGHSNGGAIALKGLSSGVLNSEKLILIASSGVRSEYNFGKKVTRLAAKAAKYPTKLLPKNTQDKIKRKAYEKIGSDYFVAEDLQETFKNIVSEDLVLESAMVAQKTLLIYGALDKATPPEYGRTFAKQIENSKLLIVEGADHFVHQTNSGEVATHIKEFLENK